MVKCHQSACLPAIIWLVLSNLAEHLGLRPPGQVEDLIHGAGLEILGISETRPRHPKATGTTDDQQLIAAARAAEVTKLYKLKMQK